MTCDLCGDRVYVIFINEKHEKVCDECYKEDRSEERGGSKSPPGQTDPFDAA